MVRTLNERVDDAIAAKTKERTGHEWQQTRPKEPQPEQRDTSKAGFDGKLTLWAWKCRGCGAYAETVKGPLSALYGHYGVPLPGREELKRWGVAKDCEQQTVDEVHDL